MPVEITEEYIRVRVRLPGDFLEETFRTVWISEEKGINSVQGKLKSDGAGGPMTVQSFLFVKEKWTEAEAVAWVKEHGHEPKSMEAGMKLSVKIVPIDGVKITKDEGGVYIEGYANTKGNKDRYGDIPTVYPAKRNFVYDLKEYLKNPVMMIDHYPGLDHVAGSMIDIHEDEKGLYFKGKFCNSELPIVKHARQLYVEGHARGISIGGRFYYENLENPSQLTLAEIYEVSLVAVGADPNALAAAMEKALKSLSDDASDKQTRASHLHEVKAAIDRWLTEMRDEKIVKALRELKDLV